MTDHADHDRLWLDGAQRCLRDAQQKIHHCAKQLTDDQLWWRPADDLNSIANLILHLRGNLTQWIVTGLTDQIDQRRRPEEFADRSGTSREQLLSWLDETVDQTCQVLDRLPTEHLAPVRRIQGFEVSAITAIWDSLPHFVGHTHQIVLMTRQMLGDRYQFQWQPSTAEEGA